MGADANSSIWITGKKSKEHTHQLRSEVDAILIGRNTAEIDNPSLTVREVAGNNPIRIIVDTNRSLPLTLNIFNDKVAKTIVLCSKKNFIDSKTSFCEYFGVNENNGLLDSSDMLEVIGKQGITSLLIEGGQQILDTFYSNLQVSRETIYSLKKYEELLIKHNNGLNLVGKSTINEIWIRHFLDSAQVIDLIDKNINSCIDIGSGAGFPGLVLALLLKDKKFKVNFKILEKSPKKCNFLKLVSSELGLNTEIICQDLNNIKKMNCDFAIARAFKPLPEIFKIIHRKINFNAKLVLFLGAKQSGLLDEASKNWNMEYKKRKSITSSDSLIIEVNKLEKLD